MRGRETFGSRPVIVVERRPIRSGAQLLRFVTDGTPTHAGIDAYNNYIDRNSITSTESRAATFDDSQTRVDAAARYPAS